METAVPIAIATAAIFLLALGAVADDRRARIRRRSVAKAVAGERTDPPLLHSINDDRCIGCEACIDVCPTEVLDLVDHKVRVARFSDCVQCEQCANACPTTALVMFRAGSVPRTITVPELDDHFQTAVPGQYLIGEVAGKPLVKNAANLGRAVIEHITRDLGTRPAPGAGVVDVVIVGSGPGGLSAGLTCVRNQLSCVVLEKEHVLASTVSRYPKGKHFMAEPSTATNVSYLPVFDGSKEELVAAWSRVVAGAKLAVKLGEAVETVVRGDDGVFEIKTTVATYRARAVVLATGLRGKPRLLAVPGANLEKVQSLLDDPGAFAGADVLVIGGGDSAVEGAMSLAELGATTTLSYRGDGFKRCKQGNQKRLAEMVAAGRLTVLLSSNVQEFTSDAATLKLEDGSLTTIPNHHAFVLIGADTPVTWLEANNVRFVEREHLYALGSTEDVVRKVVAEATECPRSPDDALALVLGKPRTHHRLRSVVEHIQDEFREVVTSVTGVFRIPTADKPHAQRAPSHHTKSGVHTVPRRPPPPPKLIPTSSLKRPPVPAPKLPPKLFPSTRPVAPNPFAPEQTVQVAALGRQPMTSVRVAPPRPPSNQRPRMPPRGTENPFADAEPSNADTIAFADRTAVELAVGTARQRQTTSGGRAGSEPGALDEGLFHDTVVGGSPFAPEPTITHVTVLAGRPRARLPGLPPTPVAGERKARG